MQQVECVADRLGRAELTGVRHGPETTFPRAPERLDVEVGRVLELVCA